MTDRIDHTKEVFNQLKQRGEDLMSTERFQSYLRSAAKFHRYSANNQWLIFIQAPEASAINSYKRWQSLGRQVRKGEHAIRILAPRPFKVQEERIVGGKMTTLEHERVSFRAVPVFSYEQTDPIEGFPGTVWEPVVFPILTAETGQEHYDLLMAHLEGLGIGVTEEANIERAAGYYAPGPNRIVVEATHPPLQRLATLLHEAAHALHFTRYNAKEDEHFKKHAYREIVAEASSYIVAEAIGFDTSEHADMYVGVFAQREPEMMDTALPLVQKISHDLIEVLQPTTEEAVAA